jgi:hypothetical protein
MGFSNSFDFFSDRARIMLILDFYHLAENIYS